MPGTHTSNCSLGVAVDFYWHTCTDPDGHIDAAVEALVAAVSGPTRRWNPWTMGTIRSEFRGVLLRAAAGDLRPVDEVKEVGDGRVRLFEIRWLEIGVTDEVERGVMRHSNVGVRLIHAEPIELSVCAVALHAHEKLVYPGDDRRTHAAQDEEIDIALNLYREGEGNLWGFTPPLRS